MTAGSGHGPVEHLDFLIVGAGLSGIGAGYHVQAECPWADYAIFEARDAIGGTWDLFRYPGIRSDSDMFTLGYSFRPWDNDQSIADGPSILRYIRDTASQYGIDRRIRYHHRIIRAEWSTAEARWTVTAERTDTGETVVVTCSFLLSCSGYYRYDHGHTPDFPGRADFRGEIVHPQHWPENLDYAGRRIVVIGSGATAVTLIPALAKKAAHVTMLQRSPTYVLGLPDKNYLANLWRRILPKRVWAPLVRWWNATTTQAFYELSQRKPKLVRRILRAALKAQLPRGYDIDTHFNPKYDPWDQRVCVVPNGDLFAAIKQGTASVVTDHIDRFTEAGIRLESGDELQADIIITATGLELLVLGGIDVFVDGEAVDLGERMLYKGMMMEGVPNLVSVFGYINASWTLKCDLICDFVCRLANHMRQAGVRQVTPRNDDDSIELERMLVLSSGYVQRSADRLPKQGTRFPWQLHNNYLRDYRLLKRRPVADEGLIFSNPVRGVPERPSPEATPSVAGVGS